MEYLKPREADFIHRHKCRHINILKKVYICNKLACSALVGCSLSPKWLIIKEKGETNLFPLSKTLTYLAILRTYFHSLLSPNFISSCDLNVNDSLRINIISINLYFI